MTDFRIIEYVPTPSAKQDGVCYIAVPTLGIGEILLGFKVITTKDGVGRFLADPAWKFEQDGSEQWKSWLMIDSNIAKERIRNAVIDYVKKYENEQHIRSQNNTPDAGAPASSLTTAPTHAVSYNTEPIDPFGPTEPVPF